MVGRVIQDVLNLNSHTFLKEKYLNTYCNSNSLFIFSELSEKQFGKKFKNQNFLKKEPQLHNKRNVTVCRFVLLKTVTKIN